MLSARLRATNLYRDYPASVTAMLIGCDASAFQGMSEQIFRTMRDQPLFTTPDEIAKARDSGNPPNNPNQQLLNITGVFREFWTMMLEDRTNEMGSEVYHTGFYEMDNTQVQVGTQLLEDIKANHPEWNLKREGGSPVMEIALGVPQVLAVELDKLAPNYLQSAIVGQVCPLLKPLAEREAASGKPVFAELTASQQQEVQESKAGKPYVIKQCAACHAHSAYPTAPYIPFDDPTKMRQALLADNSLLQEIADRTRPDASESYRMPKGPNALGDGTRRKLILYLRGLMN